jgi:hypothetical protein
MVVARCGCRVMLATMLLSHVGDVATGVIWSRCDVDAESCWQQCCRVMLTTVLQLKVLLAVVRLHSPQDRSIEVFSHDEEVEYSC